MLQAQLSKCTALLAQLMASLGVYIDSDIIMSFPLALGEFLVTGGSDTIIPFPLFVFVAFELVLLFEKAEDKIVFALFEYIGTYMYTFLYCIWTL